MRTVHDPLVDSGYTLLHANNAEEALRIYHRKHASIRLVILDMALPETNSMQLFMHLKQVNPKIRVLFTNGHDLSPRPYAQTNEGPDVITKPSNLPAIIKKYYRLSAT